MNAIVERLKAKGDHEAASALQQALDANAEYAQYIQCPGCNHLVLSLPHEDGELSFCDQCFHLDRMQKEIETLKAELKELEAAMQGELDEMREDKMYAELESEIDFMLDEPEDDELDDGIDFVDEDSDSGELPPEIQEQLDAMKKMARDAGIEVDDD